MVAVTGATGYIGRAVVDQLVRDGVAVVALSRRPSSTSADWRRYDLGEPLDSGALAGVTAVIHLAAETDRGPSPDVQREVTALERLIEASRAQNARLVFVSSQTAQANAATDYGRAKWQCELATLQAAGCVVRPGQVYGGREMGLFGTFCRFLRISRVIPRFVPDPEVQPVHVDDLARGLVACALGPDVSSAIYQIAAPTPVAFSTFLRSIADVRFGRAVVGAPFPIGIIVGLAKLPGLPLSIKGAAQRLDSLAHLPPMQTTDSLAELQLQLRPLKDGLSRSGSGRRQLIQEARTMIGYLVRGAASQDSVKRYVRVIEALYEKQPLVLAKVFRRWPSLLVLVDQPLARRAGAGADFGKRLDLATVCAETSIADVGRFLVADGSHRALGILALGWRLGLEVICQAFGLVASAAFHRLRPHLQSEQRNA
ncbi:MAG: hypothetical protein JWR80_7368 [Bradyrhizobium sp.]|nr:hypothetical protein [Bradyrhizobium sp.]